MKSKILLLLLLAVLVIPMVSAISPVTQVQQFTEGYIIEGTPQEYLQQSTDFKYNFFVYNISTGNIISNTSANCTFYMADHIGEVKIFQQVSYFPEQYWGLTLKGGNFTALGTYAYGVKCNSVSLGGAITGIFEVTKEGKQPEDNSFAIVVGLAVILMGLIASSFVWNERQWMLKTGFIVMAMFVSLIISQTIYRMSDYSISVASSSILFVTMNTLLISLITFLVTYLFVYMMIQLFTGLKKAKEAKLESDFLK